MKFRDLISCWVIAGCAGMSLALLPGCGDDDEFPKRFPVSGAVTYNGKPLEGGKIEFIPTMPPPAGHPATGVIVDGTYSITTHTQDDGALPGDYKVTVLARQYDPKMLAALEKEAGGGYHHLGSKAHIKAVKTAQRKTPAKYEKVTTTNLTAKVEEKSNTIDFELRD